MKPKITIFGSTGFIGQNMSEYAEKNGYEVNKPDWRKGVPKGKLGTLIYCNGVGDCSRPFDVLYSHVDLLSDLVKHAEFDKLVYISSTRLYMNAIDTSENSNLNICSDDKRKLFNLAKLTGEEISLSSNKNVLILRPSNVYGLAVNSPLFLPSLVRDAIRKNEINLYVSKDYSKDYLLVTDLVEYCFKLIEKQCTGIYNIASGENVSCDTITKMIVKYTATNVVWHPNNTNEKFAPVDISKVSDVINEYSPKKLMNELEQMIINFKNYYAK